MNTIVCKPVRALAALFLAACALGVPAPASASAQSLDSLIARALLGNPNLEAARNTVNAARARVRYAGSRPDPVLTAGAMNVPTDGLSFTKADMTMKVIGVRQTIPYPGKLRLSRRIAELKTSEQTEAADRLTLSVIRDIRVAYYEIAYDDAALSVVRRLDLLMSDVLKAANLRYSSGRGNQQDILRATLDATRLNETASALKEGRIASVESIASLIAGPSLTITSADIPRAIAAAAVDTTRGAIKFASHDIGAPVADDRLPSLSSLQSLAVQASPVVRELRVGSDVAAAELELSRRAHLPDVDVSIQYGQRSGYLARTADGNRVSRPDLVTLLLAVPIPLQRQARQGALALAAREDAAAADARRRAAEAMVRSDVAKIYGELRRHRTQLALYVNALLPQSRALLTSTSAAYQSGTGDLSSVLEARRALLELELGYHRSITRFAQSLAEMDAMVGAETLQ